MQARLERLEAEVRSLRQEIQELRALLGAPGNDGYELVDSERGPYRRPASPATPAPVHSRSSGSGSHFQVRPSVQRSPGETDPLQGPPAPGPEDFPRTQRDEACRQIGRFLSNCLHGRHRGASGRDLLPQGSRFWLVCRTVDGRELRPPVAYSTFAAAKPLCKVGAECREAVFIGLPSRADVDAVCAAAGLEPARYQ